MIKKAHLASIIITLLLASLLVISCTKEVTKTVTVNIATQGLTTEPTPVTKTVTIQNTITTTIQGTVTTTTLPQVTTPVFDKYPPEIPHTLFFRWAGMTYVPGQKPACFECHQIPPLHEGWLLDTELCVECHMIADMPDLGGN
jgi:hypothetical protein